MNYSYYPGCSLEGSAREYDSSTRILMEALGATLTEIEGWSCCGASAAETISFLLSMALPARNIAIAEQMAKGDILIPCSACYLNLKKVEERIKTDEELLGKINDILSEEKLELKGTVRARHLLDVLANDFEVEKIKKLVSLNLAGLKVAPYYGCQCLRPFSVFDDPEEPVSMEPLIEATGATVFKWEMGAQCCGAAHINTKPAVGEKLVGDILRNARGADVIVTVCPMCQMNLEAHQNKILKGTDDCKVSVLYLPQLLDISMGLESHGELLGSNLAVTDEFANKLSALGTSK